MVKCNRETILSGKLLEIFNGLMISDGYLDCKKLNARFEHTCVYEEYIRHIKKNFPFLWASIRCRKGRKAVIKKKSVVLKNAYSVRSRTDIFLTNQYYRWYNKKKIIPKDLEITPIMLKHWFYGDGSTSYNTYKPNIVQLCLCTNDFTHKECKLLQGKLKNIGLNLNIRKVKNKDKQRGYTLNTNKCEEVSKFFEYIGECDLSCFQYKWKLPICLKK